MPVQIALDLQTDVLSVPDVAGAKFRARICGADLAVLMPSSEGASVDEDGEGDLLGPPGLTILTAKNRWGWWLSEVCGIRAVVLEFSAIADADALSQAIRADFWAWVTRLLEWLRALSQNPMDPRVAYRQPATELIVDGGQCQPWWPGDFRPTRLGELAYAARCVSRSQWERALRETSAGVPVPPEHEIANSAREALEVGDGSRAVVEAGSACEIALAKAIRQNMSARGCDATVIDLTLERKTLGAKATLARQLDIPCHRDSRRGSLSRATAQSTIARRPIRSLHVKHCGLRRPFSPSTRPFEAHGPCSSPQRRRGEQPEVCMVVRLEPPRGHEDRVDRVGGGERGDLGEVENVTNVVLGRWAVHTRSNAARSCAPDVRGDGVRRQEARASLSLPARRGLRS
jgi:hypothetical protein